MKKIVLLPLFIGILAFGENTTQLNLQEVASFALQKHRVDFNAQTDKSKQDIVNEYLQVVKISDAISNSIKDDVDYKVASKLVALDIWAQKYMLTINPSDEELKKLYDTQQPKVSPRYKLSNILFKDEASADKSLKTLQSIKDKEKKLSKFKELVKTESNDFISKKSDGSIGYIDANKLDVSIQDALKDKKAGDVVKVNVPNIGWQILLVEEYQEQRAASMEEAKQFLVNLARQEALKVEINQLLQSKTK